MSPAIGSKGAGDREGADDDDAKVTMGECETAAAAATDAVSVVAAAADAAAGVTSAFGGVGTAAVAAVVAVARLEAVASALALPSSTDAAGASVTNGCRKNS